MDVWCLIVCVCVCVGMWVRGWMGVPVCVFVRVFVYACVSGVWVNGCARVRICALYVRMCVCVCRHACGPPCVLMNLHL